MKAYPSILCALLFAFMIIASSATTAQPTTPTKTNPFDSIINRVMHSDIPVIFDDFYPMFDVYFNNLENYEYTQTEGCTILEIYNVTKGQAMDFCPTWEAYGLEEDPYMPECYGMYFPMSLVYVYTYNIYTLSEGDLLRIRFKLPNDAEYESPVFELHTHYSYDTYIPTYYWE